jgi:hypothetical protein
MSLPLWIAPLSARIIDRNEARLCVDVKIGIFGGPLGRFIPARAGSTADGWRERWRAWRRCTRIS